MVDATLFNPDKGFGVYNSYEYHCNTINGFYDSFEVSEYLYVARGILIDPRLPLEQAQTIARKVLRVH